LAQPTAGEATLTDGAEGTDIVIDLSG